MGFVHYRIDIIGSFFSVLVAMVFWVILVVPDKFVIALVIAIMFFLTYRYIFHEKEEVSCNSISLRLKKASFSCLVVLSVLSLLLVHPIAETVEVVSWNAIPLFSLLRLILSLFLTLFSPGYMILSLIDKNGKLVGLAKILFSVLFSLVILPFFGLLSFAFGSSIQQVGTLSVILLNLILLMLFILDKRLKPKVNEKISVDLNEKAILISFLVFVSAIILSKYVLNLTWDYGDLDNYFGYSVAFTKNTLPLSPIGPGFNYPFWPFVFLAEFFVSSGVPYVNAFQFVSIPITFLPVLSFYLMVSAFFEKLRHKKIPIVATILGFFGGGFGWIFAISLFSKGQTVQNLFGLFEIAARTGSGFLVPPFYSAGIYPLYTFTLTSIFALIWLIYSERAIGIGNLRYVLVSIMVALGYLAHIAEIALFVFIFLVSILVFRRENVSSYRKYSLAIIFGLIFVALPDIITKGSYYTLGSSYYGFSLYYAVFALVVLAFFLSFAKGRITTRAISLKTSPNRIRALKIAFSGCIIYFYGLCLIIWSKVFQTYGYVPTQNSTVPWYAWPSTLGLSGLIALTGVIYLVWRNRSIKEYAFFVLLFFVSLVLARVLHVLQLPAVTTLVYLEERIAFFVMIPTIMLASYALLKFYHSLKKHKSKHMIFGFVLLMVFVLGLLPCLFTEQTVDFDYWSNGQKVSSSELNALNFLRLNTPPNGSVLTLTDRSNRLLSYAGLSDVQTYVNKDPSLVLSPLFPETAIYSLAKSQVKYLYLSSADKEQMAQNPSYSGFIGNYLLKYLPIAFQNEEITIYEVPDFSIPTSSNTALVTQNLKIGYSTNVFNESYDKYCRFCSVINAGDTITLKTDNSSNNHDFELPVNVNPNEYPYLTIQWKTDGTDLFFYLMGVNTVYYISLGSSTTWQTTSINLHNFYDFVRNETIAVTPDEQIGLVLLRSQKSNSVYSIGSIQFAGFSNNESASEFLPLSMVALSQNEYSTVLEDDPARFNYSTLILPYDLNLWDNTENQDFQSYMEWVNQGGHLIVLESLGTWRSYESRNWTVSDYIDWKDENFTEWTTFGCSAVSNGGVITVKTNNEDINHDFLSPPVNVSVDSYQYVVIHWKTDGSPLFFYPHGTESGYRYTELGASTEWTTSVIDLKNFYGFVLKNYTGFKSDEQIDKMLFRSFVKNATYSTDYIGFYKVYPLPPSMGFANALSIYRENTVEADAIESQTGHLNFPSMITVPVIHSSDVNVKNIVNYTMNNEPVSPYALTKKVGNGEVTCLAVSPYFSAIENSTSDINRDFFRYMGSLLNVVDLKLNRNIVERAYYFPQFDFIKDPINFTGKVSIDTDFIQLPYLNANSITILSNNEGTKTIDLNNSIIEKVEYVYPIKFRIDASEVYLSNSGLGTYLNIEVVGDFNLTMEIPKNGLAQMSIWSSSSLLNETFQGSTVQLVIKNNYRTLVLVKNPTIKIEGNVFFNRARIYRNYYKMTLFYDDGSLPFRVIGNTTFNIRYSDNGMSFVDNFAFNGEWSHPLLTENEQTTFTEWSIPWSNVLTSPFHLLLVVIVVILSTILIMHTHHFKISIRLKWRAHEHQKR